MMERVVGFDLDLTLIDSRPQILAAFEALSLETNVAVDVAVIETRLGLKLEDELAYWFEEESIGGAAAIYRRHYLAHAAQTVPLPGAADAVALVQSSGVRVAVVTAKHASSARPCLDAVGILPDSLHSFVHGREKAAVLRKIGAGCYIGDTPDDMHAAKDAATRAIGVSTGSFGRVELIESGADVVLETLVEFPDLWRTMMTVGHSRLAEVVRRRAATC